MGKVHREVRQIGVVVPGGAQHLGLRELVAHSTGHQLVRIDSSNAFSSFCRTSVLAEVANCVPALMPFVARFYGAIPAEVLFRMDTRGFGRSLGPVGASRGGL